MKDQNMPKADFVTALVLLAFGMTVLILSIRMPRLEELGVNPFSVPGIVPGFLGAIISLLSVTLLARSIRQKGYQLHLNRTSVIAFFRDQTTIRILLTILLSVIYGVGLLGRLPYVLATFLYMLGFVIVFEYRRDTSFFEQKKTYIMAAVLAVLVSGIVAAVFRYLFLVDLP